MFQALVLRRSDLFVTVCSEKRHLCNQILEIYFTVSTDWNKMENKVLFICDRMPSIAYFSGRLG